MENKWPTLSERIDEIERRGRQQHLKRCINLACKNSVLVVY